jgi:hypothetical protein
MPRDDGFQQVIGRRAAAFDHSGFTASRKTNSRMMTRLEQQAETADTCERSISIGGKILAPDV